MKHTGVVIIWPLFGFIQLPAGETKTKMLAELGSLAVQMAIFSEGCEDYWSMIFS